MSVWLLCFLAFLLFVIIFAYIIYKILTAPPEPDLVCNGNNPGSGPLRISNIGLSGPPVFASNTPSLNGFYNLTFSTMNRSIFRVVDNTIVLNGTNQVWTRVQSSTLGYVKLSERLEGNTLQEWNIADGRITSTDGTYIVIVSSVSGALVPQVISVSSLNDVTNKNTSCNFQFLDAELGSTVG